MSKYPAPYKIALLQMDLPFMEIQANLDKAEAMIREAAKNNAALICLPEAFNTGYDGDQIAVMIKNAEATDGMALRRMCALAKELSVFIMAPIYLKTNDGEAENSAFLIDDNGEIIGKASKTHPVGDERSLLKRGTEYPVFSTRLGKLGMLVCYDSCFPETSRLLALGGAELILITSAWRGNYYFTEWVTTSTACRALDNLVFVAHVNRVGKTCKGEVDFAGVSQIYNPIGQLIAKLGSYEEAILYADIDLSRLKEDRAFNTVLTDRHPEDYGPIASAYTHK